MLRSADPPFATKPVTLWRRFATILYDCLALFAVFFIAGGIAVSVHQGQAIRANSWWFTAYLTFAAYAYFGYCWHRGQTLGMRSWKIRIIDRATGAAPNGRQTVVRFAAALFGWLCAGLGFWCAAFDREGRTWHDRVSNTRLILVGELEAINTSGRPRE